MIKEVIINNIRELRIAAGETQESLARAVGVSRQTIIALEKRNCIPSVMLANKIAKFFKKKVEEIFHVKTISSG